MNPTSISVNGALSSYQYNVLICFSKNYKTIGCILETILLVSVVGC